MNKSLTFYNPKEFHCVNWREDISPNDKKRLENGETLLLLDKDGLPHSWLKKGVNGLYQKGVTSDGVIREDNE